MAPSTIFVIGIFTAVLLAIFVYETVRQLRKADRAERALERDETRAGGIKPLEPRPLTPHPMRVMVATDGSPCSDIAVRGVAERPWPQGTQVEVVTVVHTNIPFVPEITLVGAATHVQALEEDRQRAPHRVQSAERVLSGVSGLTVHSTVLEGDPGKVLVEEAARSKADLLVVGSHGFGPVKRMLLGSVSESVAAHAPCSVEIVRCPHWSPETAGPGQG